MPLEEYNKKRNFKETKEPEGKTKQSDKALKFVVQRHAASRLHYDFRLEMDGVLKSWAVPKGPSMNPQDKRLAIRVEDHPYAYRTFEGTIPEGNYGAGEVEIWDEGTYEPLERKSDKSDDLIMRAELHKNSLKFILKGKKLKGEFALVKIKNAKEDNAWLLIKHNDKFAVSETYDAETYTAKSSKVTALLKQKSKKKSKNTDRIIPLTKEKALQTVKPMLCKVADKPFNDADWAFEIKWDGYRAIADLSEDATVKLYSRNGTDFTKKFKKISDILKLQEQQMIVDGEIVAFDENGNVDFQSLQNNDINPNLALNYQVFDLLWLNGHSTMSLPYLQRKELLKQALVENKLIKYHDHVLEKGIDFFNAAKNMGIEGIVAKKTESVYKANVRSSEWLKIKIHKTDEALICGFTKPKGSRKNFGSLLLGKYLNGKIVFCGHVGTGFKANDLKLLYDKMEPLLMDNSPFEKNPKTNDKAFWIKPELIAEIKFTELTADKIYRHPVFLRLRNDIDLKNVRFDTDSGKMDKKMKKKVTQKNQKRRNN